MPHSAAESDRSGQTLPDAAVALPPHDRLDRPVSWLESTLELVALMIDGVHFGHLLCVVELGISIDGTKIPLAVVQGDTENTTVVKDLLVNLRERGLDVTARSCVSSTEAQPSPWRSTPCSTGR